MCSGFGINWTENSRVQFTERQTEVVEFVRRWWTEHGYGPSMREIGDGLAISKSAAFQDVTRLWKKGALAYTPGRKRSVRVAGD